MAFLKPLMEQRQIGTDGSGLVPEQQYDDNGNNQQLRKY